MDTVKLVKKDCGIHSGFTPGPCAKCKANDRIRQLTKTPELNLACLALLGEQHETSHPR